MIDSLVIIFSIVTLSYWAKIIVFSKTIELPFESEKEFDKLKTRALDTTTLRLVGAINAFLMCLKNLRYLTTQFPKFGALF